MFFLPVEKFFSLVENFLPVENLFGRSRIFFTGEKFLANLECFHGREVYLSIERLDEKFVWVVGINKSRI